MIWPLPNKDYPIPVGEDPGAFGAQRYKYIHPGVDLYCEPGDEIRAVEDGVVVFIDAFTGTKAGSPWWNDTDGILVEGQLRTICYGEVRPMVKVGDKITEGQVIATAATVMKEYKGNPMTMLHFELYKKGTVEPEHWLEKDNKPDNLQDPTELLIDLCNDN